MKETFYKKLGISIVASTLLASQLPTVSALAVISSTGEEYEVSETFGDMKTGWIKVGENWYYLNSSGAMVTGSQTIDGKVYNFASSGEWI